VTFSETFNDKDREHALAQGRIEGSRKSQADVLTKLFKRRFLESPPGLEEHMASASDSELDRWTNLMLAAATYTDTAAASAAVAPPIKHILGILEQVVPEQVEEVFDSSETDAPGEHRAILTFSDVAIKRTRIKALAEGELNGQRKQQTAVLLKLLHCKFADVPPAVSDRVTGASDVDLEQWTDNILTAATIDDVFAQ
jgi:hypothetical protein